ncbi:MAG TPA: UTP--glucose-1-phosphate uridylyltransferase GalU [Nitrospinota bacterium]|jgi:UTP--glucose-1-phosphate uridylyltransferase|nr:UTP--glucose-1-phosphate uridylyltransferase GalU [Nitrospinota bacterium]|tara:strand:+ start:141735 stop:142601 length:867 start_codon:yes stop_codon:yes gene_type:complete
MKITKAVFPVAGMGTRFLPATKASPKEMLSLVDKPLIQYVVEEAVDAGIEQIIFVTGRSKNSIEDHFDRSVELELLLERKGDTKKLDLIRHISEMCEFSYVRQKEPKGLGHAILKAKNLVGDQPFAVLLGDDIIHTEKDPAIGQLIRVHEQTNSPVIAVERVPENEVSAYGVIDPESAEGRLNKIKGMVEKPPLDKAPSNLAIIGRYILSPEIFDFIESTAPDAQGEVQLTTALNDFLQHGPIYGYEFEGTRYDAGDKLGFLKATVEYALRSDKLGDRFRSYLSSLET